MDHTLRLLTRTIGAALGLAALAGCAYDFGDCDYEWVTTLPKSDPHDVRTGAYLWDVDLDEDACVECDEDCQIDIETAFAYLNEPRSMDIMCGPMWLDGTCAVAASITDPPDDPVAESGRPYRVDGVSRVAPLSTGGRWADLSGLPEVPPAIRARVATHWARQALAEHASIASFARAVLQLIHLGAPEDLIAAAAQALAEEVDHARRAFSIASRAAGRELGPGRLDVADARPVLDLRGVAREAFVEGCIGETIGAAKAHLAASEATDAALHMTLARIAADETRHAALAWRTVRWALSRDPSIGATLVEALEQAEEAVPLRAAAQDEDPELRPWGIVSEAEGEELATRVRDEIIRPTLAALLATRAELYA